MLRLQTPEEPTSSPAKCLGRMKVLREFMNPGDVGAELGVFKGSFLDHLLSTNPAKLYAVDPWYRAGPVWKWASADPSTLNALVRILETFTEEIHSGVLIPRVELSQEFLRSLPSASLDWVYIDTTHMYDQTVLELDLCRSKVKPGGVVMGDDYVSDPNHPYYDVWRAVHQYVDAGHLELIVDGVSRQFVCKLVG